MLKTSIFQILIFVVYCSVNISDQENNSKDIFDPLKLCHGFLGIKLPCFSYYSRISPSFQVIFPMTFNIFAMFLLYNSSKTLSKELTKQFKSFHEDNTSSYNLSKIVFNSWNFKVNSRHEMVSLKQLIYNNIQTELNMKEIK